MPVKQLLTDIENSIEKNNYDRIRFKTTNHQYFAVPEDVSYVSRYFFRILTATGEVIVNINQLEFVELFNSE